MTEDNVKINIGKKYINFVAILLGALILGGVILALPNLQLTGNAILPTKQIALAYESGESVKPDKVLIDKKEVEVDKNGKIDVSGLVDGEHLIIIIDNGAKYEKTFIYYGGILEVKYSKPVITYFSAYSKNTDEPIESLSVFIDGEEACITSQAGRCEKNIIPDTHVVRLVGDGVLYEETKYIDKNTNDLKFLLDRKFSIKITTLDEFDLNYISGVDIFLDGSIKGETDYNGILKIDKVSDGQHSIQATYKSSTKNEQIDVVSNNMVFEIKMSIPRTVTLKLKDSETKKPIDSEEVHFESTTSTAYRATLKTDENGITFLDDVLPGKYKATIYNLHGYSGQVPDKLPSKVIDVGSASEIPVDLDMPNPQFDTSILCNHKRDLLIFNPRIECTVSVKNKDYDKSVDTKDTSVVLLAYSGGNLVTKSLLNFGSIQPGDIVTKSSGWLNDNANSIVAVVLEGWKYTPEDTKISTQISVPKSILDTWIDAVLQFCSQNTGECLKVIAGVVFTSPI